MHVVKRKQFMCKDAMRVQKSTQVRLDEINYRIDKDKRRIVQLNNFERIRVCNELREIRRVFVPSYIPGNTSEAQRTNNKLLTFNKQRLPHENKEAIGAQDKGRESSSPVSLPLRKLSSNLSMHDGPKVMKNQTDSFEDTTISLIGSKSGTTLFQSPQAYETRDSSTILQPQNSTTIMKQKFSNETEVKTKEGEKSRSISSASRCVQTPKGPIVSDTMASVTTGYMAFKKLLKNKRENIVRDSYVSPRYRRGSCDEGIEANSMGFLPIQKPQASKEGQLEVNMDERADYCDRTKTLAAKMCQTSLNKK
ncbi:uncharacterized protein LOC116604047 [Nematostella vectensis]|uniref:uncharacterized protein LOC116604047 n=1 Tax=Nematostella vectensis TaxID=45351 RepID=UPI0020775E84|nr:uncharacterized protein LOC116604047 [Nematostella vectensis]